MRKVIDKAKGVVIPDGPYSLAVRKGPFVFVSGQVGMDEKGQVVGDGDARIQATQAIRSMQEVLLSAGGSLDDVVRVTVFLTNIEDRDIVAEVRGEFFKDNRPASTLIEVSSLFKPGVLVEIDAIAILDE
jgi:2-iminobutanoate/2-iminopropanoate deaminase